MPLTVQEGIGQLLRQTAAEVDAALQRRLARYTGACARLAEAMRYSLEAGGKRLRPVLVLWSCEAAGGNPAHAWPAALAIECVHTFSLIHDDLPALDNDDLRRGRLTNHKVYGEATAILAGDGLLALAFEILTKDGADPLLAAKQAGELAAATGWEGMIGGELADLEGERQPPSAELVARIHAAKTARLIQASCRLGGLAAEADERTLTALGTYGMELGLAFQAVDDLLDVTGASDTLGKKTGKDTSAGKQTYVRAVGLDECRGIAAAATERAITALAPLGAAATRLVELARFVAERQA